MIKECCWKLCCSKCYHTPQLTTTLNWYFKLNSCKESFSSAMDDSQPLKETRNKGSEKLRTQKQCTFMSVNKRRTLYPSETCSLICTQLFFSLSTTGWLPCLKSYDRSGVVPLTCHLQALGGQGRQITWGQELETSLTNMEKLHLY